jgi:hypothetical protein
MRRVMRNSISGPGQFPQDFHRRDPKSSLAIGLLPYIERFQERMDSVDLGQASDWAIFCLLDCALLHPA